jgi:hypothetical protein
MRHWLVWGLSFALLIVGCLSGTAFGGIEAGVGIMAPGGDRFGLGTIVLVPKAAIGLGPLGVSLDLWFSPGNPHFVLLPFLQAELPLILLKIYGGLAPIVLGDSSGLTLVPPSTEFVAKAGIRVAPLILLGVYGEMVLGISPLHQSIPATSFVFGMSLGF